MPFYRQTIGGHFYKDYKNGNSKRVSEKEYLKNVRRVRGGAKGEEETKKAVESKVVSSKKYTCECSCEKIEKENKEHISFDVVHHENTINALEDKISAKKKELNSITNNNSRNKVSKELNDLEKKLKQKNFTSNNPMGLRRPST